MKRTILSFSLLAAITAVLCSVFAPDVRSQNQPKKGYIRPELRGAITVTPKMLAPLRFSPGEHWFSAVLDDPRTGKFKGGYFSLKFSSNARGLQVISIKNVVELKTFSTTTSTTDSEAEEIYSPAYGRILKGHANGDFSAILSYGSPVSSVHINKTAEYDWDNKRIIVRHENDPKAPVRTYPLEDSATSLFAIYHFMLSGKWTDTSKIYRFHYFDIEQEIYRDFYIRCAGRNDKNTIKYESVWHGWGEGGQLIYWVTPPKAGAPNGMFQKFIVDPKVTRYTTYILTTKKEALKPVRPMVD